MKNIADQNEKKNLGTHKFGLGNLCDAYTKMYTYIVNRLMQDTRPRVSTLQGITTITRAHID